MERTIKVRICDMPHRGQPVEATTTVTIGLNGEAKKLDLCRQHHTDFNRATRTFLKAIDQQLTDTKPTKPKRQSAKRDSHAADIRAWARKHDIEVPERGRIPRAITDQYVASL